MTHSVKEQIIEIAALKNISVEEAIEESKAEIKKVSEDIIVWNRRDESLVKVELDELKEKIKQEKIDEERAAGFRWTKEDGAWVVAGDFSGKSKGDKITVVKKSGQKQEKEIVAFTSKGNAWVK